MPSADPRPASAGEDLELLIAELARKGWGAGRLHSLRARWEQVCGRGGRSLPEAPSEPEVTYRVDPDDSAPPVEINCAERVHLCKAVCCRLNFALTPSEVRSGKIAWDPEFPYLIRHQPNGYCSHYETGADTATSMRTGRASAGASTAPGTPGSGRISRTWSPTRSGFRKALHPRPRRPSRSAPHDRRRVGGRGLGA